MLVKIICLEIERIPAIFMQSQIIFDIGKAIECVHFMFPPESRAYIVAVCMAGANSQCINL